MITLLLLSSLPVYVHCVVTRKHARTAETERRLYINLYSPTSGSKERNIQTYKYDEKATKKTKKKTASKCRLHATMLLHAIIQYYIHHYYTNTNLKRIRGNFTENIFGTGEPKIK